MMMMAKRRPMSRLSAAQRATVRSTEEKPAKTSAAAEPTKKEKSAPRKRKLT